jgi:isoleucyl-tRNA synthetase
MYAEVDGWEWDGTLSDPLKECKNPLDQWIVSRLHQLVGEVEEHMDGYDIPSAIKPILPFIEDASNWYVRRSRRRFWKNDEPEDKAMAYRTLHYVLVRLMYVMAPFTPFLADEYFRKLTGKESVHLEDWLPAGHVDELVVRDMEEVRSYVSEGLALRASARLKVRQPLASVTVPKLGEFVNYEDILRDELNVKNVKVGTVLELDMELTPALKREGQVREVVRHVQAARKQAGLQVDDRIELLLTTEDSDLRQAIEEHEETILSETLAKTLGSKCTKEFQSLVKVDGVDLAIGLEKAA